MYELEMQFDDLRARLISQAEATLQFDNDRLCRDAATYGYSELQYNRILRNISFFRAKRRELVKPDSRIESELFRQGIGASLNLRKMQELIAKNNFIIGAYDGTFTALTGHSYMHGLHEVIRTEDEPLPEGGTPILAVISEIGIILEGGSYHQVLPAAFRVLNQENHGATLDEAHFILSSYME